MSEWTAPPQSVEYRAPTEGRVVRNLFEALSRRISALEGTAPLKQAGVRGRPGLLASLDYDGTDRTHLGTAGWMLGAEDGGASYLALNGIDVYATLAERIAEIADLQADMATAQETLAAQVADLAAVVNAQVTGGVGNNYVLTAVTSSWANYAGVSIPVPAGFTRAQVMAVSSVIGPTTDTWQIRVDIAGVTGAEYTVFGNNGALGFAHNLAGLSGGSITVATGVRNAVASGNNRGIATSATVTFLR